MFSPNPHQLHCYPALQLFTHEVDVEGSQRAVAESVNTHGRVPGTEEVAGGLISLHPRQQHLCRIRMSPGEMRVLLLILGSLKSSVAHPKEQRAEDGPVESPYQELGLGERDLYSDLNLRYK
ncbi:uncharacterized protein LOC144612165 isoform X1 [Rhinoraja longicauda]